jgi:apolipoprotein D and lipocalin family protein
MAGLGLLLGSLTGCLDSPNPPPLAADVNLDAMLGGWYIVATIPNHFEKGMVAPYDVYARRPDGDIQEEFHFRRGGLNEPVKHASVHDFIVPGSGNARWRVQIVWPLKLPFLVLYTDPGYRYVLFGEADRSLGWIYSRTPDMTDADYRRLLAKFAELGYDPGLFRRIVHFPSQIGAPGFWSDGIAPGAAPN